MLRHAWQRLLFLKNRFTQGAAILTMTTLGSYVTGLLRDRTFAHTFGASRELDLYQTSLIIPELLLNILVSSALSAAFIPLFTSLWTTQRQQEAEKLGRTIIHSAVIVIVVVSAITALFMPAISKLIAPGFTAAEQVTLTHISRLMLISPALFALSSSLGAILVSFKNFLPYGLSPILYNLGSTVGALLAVKFGVHGLVLGTLGGAALHSAPRIFAISKSPFRYSLGIDIKDKNFLSVLKLMIPKMVGHPVEQLTFLAFTRIATLLAIGSVAAVNFARNFQSVPVSLFGIAFSVAIFPVLCESAGKRDLSEFSKNFKRARYDILIFTLPATLGLYMLSDLPIRIFLGGGRFTDENILITARVLSLFALSIPSESLKHLLARSFYALKNTITPVALSVINLAVSAGVAWYKARTIGVVAIPIGFFMGSVTEVILLSILLRREMKKKFA